MSVKIKHLFSGLLIGVLILLELKYHFLYTPSTTIEPSAAEMTQRLMTCNFEVFGKVQGVWFRVNTENKANELGARGWCMNTKDGSVKGTIEAEESVLDEMKHWLWKVGSPQSRIDKAVFTEAKEINEYTFDTFGIKRVSRN